MNRLQTLDPSGGIGLMTPRNSSRTNSRTTEKDSPPESATWLGKLLKADLRYERLYIQEAEHDPFT